MLINNKINKLVNFIKEGCENKNKGVKQENTNNIEITMQILLA